MMLIKKHANQKKRTLIKESAAVKNDAIKKSGPGICPAPPRISDYLQLEAAYRLTSLLRIRPKPTIAAPSRMSVAGSGVVAGVAKSSSTSPRSPVGVFVPL